ncbi:flagellar hook-basal body complex protein [Reinekea marinisedimentorum]|uniref:Flagellar hook protein FlgE n=1 Tax=Reinekea marinisedimentorum TaxID=230495 RepID=A0A4R3I2P4_9GAMM|nr:flagellar hook-basal body complex protein [Reinekea marinisedimentorum]TCS39918.1 flagellar hook-basal body protein [Reinekea marinisedimentorum]
MSFSIGLSGVAAANTDLSVTGNNIANASTTGFKASTTEFGDAYTTSLLGSGSDIVGSGVTVTNIGQSFEQGTITASDSSLDLAIDGDGFFVLEYDNGTTTYSRSGGFGLDTEGYVVSVSGATLQGYGVDNNGVVSGILTDLQVDADNIAPQRTTEVETQLNVPSYAEVLASEGSITETNGFAIGQVQTGSEDDVSTTLSSVGYPTTAGVASAWSGGIVHDNSDIDFPWQPDSAESSYSIDITLSGSNIDTETNSLVGTIVPFSSENIYESVDDLVDAINSAINADSDLAGMVQATVNNVGGVSFEAAGTYATDGTSIVNIEDNVGNLLGDSYLNFENQSVVVYGTSEAGLTVTNSASTTTVSSGRDLTSIDTESGFLSAYANDTIDFYASVAGTSYPISITIPSTGYADFSALVSDLNAEFTAEGAGITASVVNDRLVFTSDVAGDVDVYFTTSTLTSDFDVEVLGITTSSLYSPSTSQGVDANNTMTIATDTNSATISIGSGTYADADALALAINGAISGSAVDGEVSAYAIDGTLYFDRLDSGTASTLAITDGTAGATDLEYFGLNTTTSITSPSVTAAVAGTDLFANNGSIDLSSSEGDAVTVQGNSTSELTFTDYDSGTYATLTSALPISTYVDTSGAVASTDAGNWLAFDITIGTTTEQVTMQVPAGGWADTTTFLSELETEIEDEFGSTDVIDVSLSAANELVLTAGSATGVGSQTINISDYSGTVVSETTSFTMSAIGMQDDGSSTPDYDAGEEEVLANNVLEISIDGADGQTIVIPEGTYTTYDGLVAAISDEISSNSALSGEIDVSHVNGRLVFERTEIGSGYDIDISGDSEALETLGLDSTTTTLGTDSVDKSNSFTINLVVPDPDEDGRSGSVTISLDETIYSIDQLATSINRELASVDEADYIGVQAVVSEDEDGNEILTFVATEAGEESTISITNIQATGDDLDVNELYGLLQADQYDSSLLTIGEAATTNGYPAQTVQLYNEADDVTTEIVIEEGSQASEIASLLSGYGGVTATAETDLTLFAEDYVNSGLMDLYINGQVIESDDFADIVDEINSYSSTTLSSITASLDEDTGNILLTSSIGIDISVEVDSVVETDQISLQGSDGATTATLGGDEDAETFAVVGGSIEIVLNDGYTLEDPDPSVTGLFNGLTSASYEEYTINSFDPDNTDTYNETASITVYDSLGNQHEMQMYYVKNEADGSNLSSWTVYVQIDGENVGDPDATLDYPDNLEPTMASFQMYFNADGSLDEDSTGEFLISNWDPIDSEGASNGSFSSLNVAEGGVLPIDSDAENSNFAISFTDSTQYGSEFARYDFAQDGYTSGELTDLEIDGSGIIYAQYTNGESEVIGQVALATFTNTEGLTPSGDTEWTESSESGEPTIGEPGTGTLGSIESSALEDSTVDLSEELVQLIIAQRNYQASAKTIETANEVTQTIINLR